MRATWSVCVFLGLGLLADNAAAVDLRYAWKKGATARFVAKSTEVVASSGMGMDMNQKFNTETQFVIKVDRVNKTGAADGNIVIEKFSVKTADGRTMAGIESLPKEALKNPVSIDSKGRFTFKQILYLLVDEDSGANLLVSAKAGPNSASATGQAGGEQVSVYAQFDPKTGQLSGGYTVKKVAEEKKRKTVAVSADATKVDLLPLRLLELLALPDGDLTSGAEFVFNIASTTVRVKAEEITPALARLRNSVSTKIESAGASDTADAPPEGMAMPGFGAMPGMPAAPGQPGGQPGGVGMSMAGDFVTRFDVTAGMLAGVDGTLEVEMGMGGMKLTTTSTVQLERLR